MDMGLYARIVEACPPEMRHEIKKLDGRTGRAMRRKSERETAVQNIESLARTNTADMLDILAEMQSVLMGFTEKERVVLRLYSYGYKYCEIAKAMNVCEKTVRRFFKTRIKMS